jgi:hypothetical protein
LDNLLAVFINCFFNWNWMWLKIKELFKASNKYFIYQAHDSELKDYFFWLLISFFVFLTAQKVWSSDCNTKFHWLNIGSNYMIVPTKCFKNPFHFKKIICRANPWLGISCWWDATSTKQKKEHDNACYCLTAYFRERESCHLTAAPNACLLLREYLWV